jgi:hypothetical protein
MTRDAVWLSERLLRWLQSPEYRLRGPNGEEHGLTRQLSVDVSARGAPKRFRSVASEIPQRAWRDFQKRH